MREENPHPLNERISVVCASVGAKRDGLILKVR